MSMNDYLAKIKPEIESAFMYKTLAQMHQMRRNGNTLSAQVYNKMLDEYIEKKIKMLSTESLCARTT